MLAPKLTLASSQGDNKAVFNSARRFALDGFSDLIRVLMESVDDALFDLSDKVDNDRERNMYFEAMREIRMKRSVLQKTFDYELQQCFSAFTRGKSAGDAHDDDDELTLVELDEFEDSIAIDNMISKARPHFEDDLFAVTERLRDVLGRKSISEDENPLDPKAICDCFHSASEQLETDIEVKLIFYKLFEKYVLNNLGHFYKELNALFIENGVLPDFSPEQERMKQTTRFMASRINKSGPQSTGNPLSQLPLNAAATADTAAFNGGNLFAALQQAMTSAPGGFGVSGGGTAGTGMAGNGQSGGQIEQFEPAGGIVAPPQGGGFVAALTDLQASSLSNQPLATIDPQNMKIATQQQLVAFRQENVHHSNAADNQTIDVVSMLFDFFFDDEALPAPIKVLIGRLQIPILKVAIIDKDFFNQKKHPARKLLDSISRASLGWDESHPDQQPLIDKAEEIVNYLINEFNEDVSVFETALADFESFISDEQQEIEKAETALRQQEQEKDELIQAAQDAADALIKKLTDSRELSYEVIDFLETTWTSVLFNAYLSLGESSNHWRNLKSISTAFVWSLVPKFSEEERLKIIKTIPSLLRALSKGMELVRIDPEEQNRTFQMLAQEHAKIVKQTSKNIVTRVDDETVWPENNSDDFFAKAQELAAAKSIDFDFSAIDDEVQAVEIEVEEDSMAEISEAPTEEVIDDLNQFIDGVMQGEITVDEEIILGTADEDVCDLADDGDGFLEQAQNLEIGSWVEFSFAESKTLIARLSWRSNVTGTFVFVNRQGHKIRNLTINGFAMELRAGRVKCIESSSVFDRAIYNIMSKMQNQNSMAQQPTP